jgi:hypothetical protein
MSRDNTGAWLARDFPALKCLGTRLRCSSMSSTSDRWAEDDESMTSEGTILDIENPSRPYLTSATNEALFPRDDNPVQQDCIIHLHGEKSEYPPECAICSF